jgi:hypothetical protein
MAFLNDLVAFFASKNLMPSEIASSDTDREKTYMQYLPAEPANVWCIKIYDAIVPPLVGKQAGVYRIQVTVRNKSHKTAFNNIYALWQFLINRPDFIEAITVDGYYVIFDAQNGPIPAGQDEKGNYLYTLNFPVKTKMF